MKLFLSILMELYMQSIRFILPFFLSFLVILPTTSMEVHNKLPLKTYLHLLPPELYQELLKFKQHPEVTFWEIKLNEKKGFFEKQLGEPFPQTLFIDNETTAFSGGFNTSITAIDTVTGTQRTVKGSSDIITALALDTKRKQLLAGTRNGMLQGWDSINLTKNHTQFINQYNVNALCIDENEDLLISGSDDCTIRVWRLPAYQCSKIVPAESVVRSLILDKARKYIIAGLHNGSIQKYDYHGQYFLSKQLHDCAILCFNIDQRNNILLSGSLDGSIKVSDLNTHTCTMAFDTNILLRSLGLYNHNFLLHRSNISMITIQDLNSGKSVTIIDNPYKTNSDVLSITVHNTTNSFLSNTPGRIFSWKLINESLHKKLWHNMNISLHTLLEAAYISWAKDTPLDLNNNQELRATFNALANSTWGKELQETIATTIKII